MRKILNFTIIGWLALLAVAGCAREQKPDEYQSSVLEDLPFVYKMTVQQGNIVTEEMVDALEPGMTKRQVRYLMGTPMLTDIFHADRWDYTYTIRRGHKQMEVRRLTLHFQEDALVRIEGDMRPNPQRAQTREPKEIMVDVPDYRDRKGLVRRALEAAGAEPAK